jgi:isoleucyl-tRNA synthetase
LYRCLVAASKLFAPFTPYLAEAMFRNLVANRSAVAEDSVHLASWPGLSPSEIRPALQSRMRAVRELVSLGLSVRTQAKIRVRQPLSVAHLILPRESLTEALRPYEALIKEELNVEEVRWEKAAGFVAYKPKPNFRTLGQRGLGKEAQMLKSHMASLSEVEANAFVGKLLEEGKAMLCEIELLIEDVELALETKPGLAAAGGRSGVVVLDTRLDARLLDRGLFREILSRVQAARKDAKLDFIDRIDVWLEGSPRVIAIVRAEQETFKQDALVRELALGRLPDADTDIATMHHREIMAEDESFRVAFCVT